MPSRLAHAVRTVSLAFCLVSSFTIALSAATARVAPGTERAFAASYQLNSVEKDGSQVHVTMLLTLQNPGVKDVKGGIVAVFGSQSPAPLLGSFSAIKTLPHQGAVTVSSTLTIPATEYASWQHGHAPVLEFLVPSGDTAIAEGIQSHQVSAPPKRTE